jgi:hypothetical protein
MPRPPAISSLLDVARTPAFLAAGVVLLFLILLPGETEPAAGLTPRPTVALGWGTEPLPAIPTQEDTALGTGYPGPNPTALHQQPGTRLGVELRSSPLRLVTTSQGYSGKLHLLRQLAPGGSRAAIPSSLSLQILFCTWLA